MEKLEDMQFAGFWLRFIAMVIDYFVIQFLQAFIIVPFILIFALGYVLPVGMEGFNNPHFDWESEILYNLPSIISGVFFLILIILSVHILYYSIMESSKQQATLGKIAVGLKVTNMDGERLDFLTAFLRNLGKILSQMTIYIGYIMAGFTPKKQALHDILTNTLVVRNPPRS